MKFLSVLGNYKEHGQNWDKIGISTHMIVQKKVMTKS